MGSGEVLFGAEGGSEHPSPNTRTVCAASSLIPEVRPAGLRFVLDTRLPACRMLGGEPGTIAFIARHVAPMGGPALMSGLDAAISHSITDTPSSRAPADPPDCRMR